MVLTVHFEYAHVNGNDVSMNDDGDDGGDDDDDVLGDATTRDWIHCDGDDYECFDAST